MSKHLVFVVYPSYPPQIGSAIDDAMEILKAAPYNQHIETWREIESPGHFIVEGILDRIDASHYVVADITHLNFNVTFEVGYAIGRSKRVILIINKAFTPAAKEIAQLGVYDTLIHKTYENSKELVEHLSKLSDMSPLNFPDYPIDSTAPIYILDTSYKTNAAIRIMSKVKKSRIRFRSFDPKEQPRISALEAYREVKKSIAVIINLLSSLISDSYINNLRGAFLAGLSYGLDKEVLILQDGDEPVPLDYRDFVSVYRRPEDIDPYINELAPRVVESLQTVESRSEKRIEGLLANIDIGATAAENEMYNLGNYYVPTNQFNQALEGLIRIVVGRKGSGKTALFFQTRDNLRAGKHNIILDLKPDGHQLMRFKYVLNLLSEPVMEHFATTFWEYVLLLEITHKLLQIDHILHKRNHTLFVPYQQLYTLYAKDGRVGEVDFSERMLERVNRIKLEFEDLFGFGEKRYLFMDKVTELIYKHDIPELRTHLIDYLLRKGDVWILFDNIDKGWPTRGIDKTDIVILRSLIDAARKIEHFLRKHQINFYSIIFVRNDVYELLVDESPDRGKEAKGSLDWTDPDLLREVLRRRLVYSGQLDSNISFQDAWHQVCVSHIDGEDSSEYLINRSLMRPRNLLALFNHCKSNAVNLQHAKINEEDIKKACSIYSSDILNEIGLEIRDVFPEAKEEILYHFIEAPQRLSVNQVRSCLKESNLPPEYYDQLIGILLWFGFLGVRRVKEGEIEELFIYDVYYDMKKLMRLAKDLKDDDMELSIHCAFWPFLDISNHKSKC